MAQTQMRHAFLLFCCFGALAHTQDDVSEETDARLTAHSSLRGSEQTSASIRRLSPYPDTEPVYFGLKWWQWIIVVFCTLLATAGIVCCCMIAIPLLGLDFYLGCCGCCEESEKKQKKDRSHRRHRDEASESEALQEEDDEDDEYDREREEYERERRKRKKERSERRRDREERRRGASEERRRDASELRRRDASEERRRDASEERKRRDASDEEVEPSGCCGGQQRDRKDRRDKRRRREDEERQSQQSMEMARSYRHGASQGVYSYHGSPYEAEFEQTQQDGTYNRYADVYYSGQQMKGSMTQPTYGFSGEGTVPLPSFPNAHDHTGRSLGRSQSPPSRAGGVQAYQSNSDEHGRRVLETIVHEPVRESDTRGYPPVQPAPNSFAGSLLNKSYAVSHGHVSALSLQEQLAQAAAPKLVGEVVHEPVVPGRLGEIFSSGNFAQSGLATSAIPGNLNQSLSSAPYQSYQASYDARTPKMLIL